MSEVSISTLELYIMNMSLGKKIKIFFFFFFFLRKKNLKFFIQ